MENFGYIEIKVTGSKGKLPLTPETFDIREITDIIEQAEKLLFPGEKKDRPLISYKMEEGSVRNIFRTGMQAVTGFGAVLRIIQSSESIDFLELNTAKAIEAFQQNAVKKEFVFEIRTSLEDTPSLRIDSSTNFSRTTDHWVDAEFYFYGKITNAGGKDKANIHLVVDELGTLIIQTPQQFLANREENLLYKTFGIRVKGKQNSDTGEIDKSSFTFIDLIDFNKKYDELYLKNLRGKAGQWLKGINPDDWINEIRGYDA